MKTEELIERLAADLQPIPHGAMRRRVFRATSMGAAIAFVFVALGYGLRDDLIDALGRLDFWRKLGFTLVVGVLGLAAVLQASRPGVKVMARVIWLAAPFVAIASLAVVELTPLPAAERRTIWLGETAMSCPWSILALSVPVLTALLLSMRPLAPTRPPIAGLVAGLAAGGLAATMYALHCPEWAASFVATWYALGIVASGLLGAAVGSRVLRW
jgi:hypothetical protein